MRLLYGLIAATCSLVAFAGVASGQEKSELQVAGLTIAALDSDSEFGQSLMPGVQAGTQIYLRLKLPGRFILELDEAGQKVSLTDGAGKDLKTRESDSFAFFANISEDHQSVTLPISGEAVPPAGTEHVLVKGEVSVLCGSELTEAESEVALVESEKVMLGTTEANITSVGGGFEENSTSVDFESKSPFNTIKELRFVDGNGKEHVAESRGSGRFGFGGDVTYSQSYEFPAAAEDIKSVKLTYFKKVEAVKVPIDVKVGLSLGQ